METDKIIKTKLQAMGEKPDNVKPFLYEYLRQIEAIITQKNEELNHASDMLSKSVYSVKSIAETIGMSRTTFYSYDKLLQRYIEYSLQETEKDNPYIQITELRETIQEQKAIIGLMESRDVSELLLKHQIKELKNRLSERDKEIARLRARVAELSSGNLKK